MTQDADDFASGDFLQDAFLGRCKHVGDFALLAAHVIELHAPGIERLAAIETRPSLQRIDKCAPGGMLQDNGAGPGLGPQSVTDGAHQFTLRQFSINLRLRAEARDRRPLFSDVIEVHQQRDELLATIDAGSGLLRPDVLASTLIVRGVERALRLSPARAHCVIAMAVAPSFLGSPAARLSRSRILVRHHRRL